MKIVVQDDGVIAAWSRWRWTIVVVRQFSLVATSLNHPPAGIWRGVSRTALIIPSRTGRSVSPGVFSWVWLFSVMACSPGLFPVKPAPGGADYYREGSILPGSRLPVRRICRRKRSGDTSLRAWSVNTGTSVWLSRVFPRDPHSDQNVSSCSTYNRKICRVLLSYYPVQWWNRSDGKDINAGWFWNDIHVPFIHGRSDPGVYPSHCSARCRSCTHSQILRLVQYPCPHFS